ncbi:MAG: hypothetical protein ACP5RT_00535 [Candidatus Micrarchaeia archaeon]
MGININPPEKNSVGAKKEKSGPGASETNVSSQKKSNTKIIKYVIFSIVAVIIIAMAVMALTANNANYGFPSSSEVSSALNSQFTAGQTNEISSSSPTLASFASFGVTSAEVENYTSPSGIVSIGELKFNTASNATKVFNLISSLAENSTKAAPSGVTIQTYKGAKYIIINFGGAGAYENYIFVVNYSPTNVTAAANETEINSLIKYTISSM